MKAARDLQHPYASQASAVVEELAPSPDQEIPHQHAETATISR